MFFYVIIMGDLFTFLFTCVMNNISDLLQIVLFMAMKITIVANFIGYSGQTKLHCEMTPHNHKICLIVFAIKKRT